jgi:hypothetical protein
MAQGRTTRRTCGLRGIPRRSHYRKAQLHAGAGGLRYAASDGPHSAEKIEGNHIVLE